MGGKVSAKFDVMDGMETEGNGDDVPVDVKECMGSN